MKTNTTELLTQLQARIHNHIETIENEFLHLTDKELNVRPAEDKWSIAECMAHLNQYARHYNPVMDRKMKQSKASPNVNYSSGWMGEKFTNMMAPQQGKIVNPMNTFKSYNPIGSQLDAQKELKEQINHLNTLIKLLDKARSKNIEKIKIPITISKLIKIRLGDTFRFNEAHVHRHLLQAQNVKSATLKAHNTAKIAH